MRPDPFLPFPELHTGRLLLRQITPADEQEVFFLRSDARVNTYVGRQRAHTLDDARQHIQKLSNNLLQHTGITWAIVPKGASKMVGSILLWSIDWAAQKAEVGYELHPDFQRQGIMQEALQAVLEFAFQTLEFRRIEAFTMGENLGSVQLLNKFKFSRDAAAEQVFRAEYPDDAPLQVFVLTA
ncbi:MAG: GNAT family N-acetyltransferase [Saprospiraceae bacterium]|nr:GNAT family N-acetyltransferase [Saprospiraceae bacterium]